MAELRNCARCGKLFPYIGRPICNRCVEKEEEEFKIVKEYIYDNPGATVFEVADATEVSVDKIMRFLREERLEISSENVNLILECESCSRPIKSGRYCEECKAKLAGEMRREFGIGQRKRENIRTSGKEKMHVIRKREGR
ncbi:MAG: MerR family transcriptional regulator [Firmicutes bacterium]|nr:MerR family transcriptional regulator [Bacillota bacterium]